MSRSLLASLGLLSLVVACSTNTASEPFDSSEHALGPAVTEVRNFGENPGGLKMFEYVPRNLAEQAPLVLVLHGCMQSSVDAAKTGWNSIADELGVLLVYPEQQTNNNQMRCFNWAGEFGDPANLQRGKGENQSLKEMVAKASKLHSVDPKRIFIVGFSGGGATAALAAATWPDVFAGAATLAGIPYDCTRQFSEVSGCLSPGKDKTAQDWGKRVRDAFPDFTGPWPRMSIWQGSADNVVAPMNRTQLIRQWTNVHGLPITPSATNTVDGYPHSVFKNAAGETVVETFEITGMGHGVPVKAAGGTCGATGQYALDKGICAARHIAGFFGLTTPTTP
jgi:poly(hydroxyalkanoate) depolymerase family esterase